MNEEALLGRFRTCLINSKIFDRNKFLEGLSVIYPNFDYDNVGIKLSMNEWERLSPSIDIILASFPSLRTIESWHEKIEFAIEFFLNFEILLKNIVEHSVPFDSLNSYLMTCLGALGSRLTSLISDLPPSIPFQNTLIRSDRAATAMEHFISTAELIRNDPEYSNSHISKLDSLLYNTQLSISSHFPREVAQFNIQSSRSFVALAAPSMEGKSQSAFVFSEVKPLYFCINFEISDATQPIYLNFSSLNSILHRIALLDLANILRFRGTAIPQDLETIDIHVISATDIKGKFMNVDLFVLGFLKSLVLDGNSNFNQGSWMLYHATRSDFLITRARISDIPVGFFNGYCLFLDEFVGKDWAVYVRNLARAVGLRCVVANTNTRITNLTGKTKASGSEGVEVWSIIVNRLNPASYYVLNALYNIEDSIREISHRGESDPAVVVFLNNFMETQFSNLRPGVAVFISQALNDFKNLSMTSNRPVTILNLLNHVISFVQIKMVQRKISLASQTQSSWGKIMLLTPFAYQNAEIRDDEELFHFRLFIEYHLYYLVNPYDPNGWIFLSFSSIDQINGRSYLKVLRNNGISDWINDFTFFRSEELLTTLISVFIPFITPVTAILKAAQRITAENVRNIPNSSALSLPGNPLEVSAAVSVIDASHHLHGQMSQSYTLEGQNGSIFIKNLIVNLISVRGFSKQNEISITYPVNKFNLERDFIDKCRIPFLYALDRSIPILDQISGSQSQSIYFSRYERTSNLSQIDGKFVFLLSQTEYTAVVECKNRQDSINGKILFECLTKARSKPGSKLCIIFCRICIPASTLRSKFTKFCRLKKINVYRVKREGNMAFKIEVFSDKFCIFPNPNFICIIFESSKINRDINFLEM